MNVRDSYDTLSSSVRTSKKSKSHRPHKKSSRNYKKHKKSASHGNDFYDSQESFYSMPSMMDENISSQLYTFSSPERQMDEKPKGKRHGHASHAHSKNLFLTKSKSRDLNDDDVELINNVMAQKTSRGKSLSPSSHKTINRYQIIVRGEPSTVKYKINEYNIKAAITRAGQAYYESNVDFISNIENRYKFIVKAKKNDQPNVRYYVIVYNFDFDKSHWKITIYSRSQIQRLKYGRQQSHESPRYPTKTSQSNSQRALGNLTSKTLLYSGHNPSTSPSKRVKKSSRSPSTLHSQSNINALQNKSIHDEYISHVKNIQYQCTQLAKASLQVRDPKKLHKIEKMLQTCFKYIS